MNKKEKPEKKKRSSWTAICVRIDHRLAQDLKNLSEETGISQRKLVEAAINSLLKKGATLKAKIVEALELDELEPG